MDRIETMYEPTTFHLNVQNFGRVSFITIRQNFMRISVSLNVRNAVHDKNNRITIGTTVMCMFDIVGCIEQNKSRLQQIHETPLHSTTTHTHTHTHTYNEIHILWISAKRFAEIDGIIKSYPRAVWRWYIFNEASEWVDIEQANLMGIIVTIRDVFVMIGAHPEKALWSIVEPYLLFVSALFLQIIKNSIGQTFETPMKCSQRVETWQFWS